MGVKTYILMSILSSIFCITSLAAYFYVGLIRAGGYDLGFPTTDFCWYGFIIGGLMGLVFAYLAADAADKNKH